MIFKITLTHLVQQCTGAVRSQTPVFIASLALVSGFMFGSGAGATEAAAQLSALESDDLTFAEAAADVTDPGAGDSDSSIDAHASGVDASEPSDVSAEIASAEPGDASLNSGLVSFVSSDADIEPEVPAVESADAVIGPAMAAFEPTGKVPEAVDPEPVESDAASSEQSVEQRTSSVAINLDYVQDLTLIIEEARKQAQVEYLAEKLRKPPHTLQEYVQLAWAEASKRAGLRPELLIAIMQKESTFQPKVQSKYGAQGLMQVVRRWHHEKLHKNESLFDPEVNVRVGTDVLEEYLEWADGDLSKALAKYSGNARDYADAVLDESHKLAQVADSAAAQVAMAPDLFEPALPAEAETDLRASTEQAG